MKWMGGAESIVVGIEAIHATRQSFLLKSFRKIFLFLHREVL